MIHEIKQIKKLCLDFLARDFTSSHLAVLKIIFLAVARLQTAATHAVQERGKGAFRKNIISYLGLSLVPCCVQEKLDFRQMIVIWE